MELIHREVRLSRRCGELKIACMGCMHYGAKGVREDLIDAKIEEAMSDRDMYVILGGDLIDGIHEKDKRYTSGECSYIARGECECCGIGESVVQREARHLTNKMQPLIKAGKILWWHEGNHESAIYTKQAGHDYVREWCSDYKIPYAGIEALSWLTVISPHGKRTATNTAVRFYTTHGTGSATTDAAAIRKLEACLHTMRVDVAASWHWHRLVAKPVHRQLGMARPRRGSPLRMRTFDSLAVACGTFLDSHVPGTTGYGERAGYRPLKPGCATIRIKPEVGNNGTERMTIEADTGSVSVAANG